MKKNNKLLIIILTCIVTLMMGYALFSENITVTGTATAKGDFSYSIETMKGINSEIISQNLYAIYYYGGETSDTIHFIEGSPVTNSSISHTENTITHTSNLTNPGQIQYFTAKITNTGTIPMEFDIYYDFSEMQTISGNLIMSDGILFDVAKIKDASSGHYGNAYGFTATDYSALMYLKGIITNLYDVFVSKKHLMN